ncbi:MAG: hypothetical protein ACLFVU_03305 [Phycisphaerae bacterium]
MIRRLYPILLALAALTVPLGAKTIPSGGDHAPSELPDNGLVRLDVRGAMVRFGDKGNQRRDLELNLTRHKGEFQPVGWGKAMNFNQGEHKARVLGSKPADDGGIVVRVELLVEGDIYGVKGGYALYEITLKAGDDGVLAGTYKGLFSGTNVSGKVDVRTQSWPEEIAAGPEVSPGEHPRIVFRKEQIPEMRKRAQSGFGKQVVEEIKRRVGGGAGSPDAAIGSGFLYAITGEKKYARQVVKPIRQKLKRGGGGHAHDGARQMQDIGIAFDLAYDGIDPKTRQELIDEIAPQAAALGTMGLANNSFSPNSNWSAIAFGGGGTGCLALWKETGRFALRHPEKVDRVHDDLFPDDKLSADGVPVNTIKNKQLITDWIAAGPFNGLSQTHPLKDIGGPDAAKPEKGTKVTWKNDTYEFRSIDKSWVAAAPVPQVRPWIQAPKADSASRTFLYCLIKVDEQTALQLDAQHPVIRRPSYVWIDGTQIEHDDIVILQPGKHRLMVEVRGGKASPIFQEVEVAQNLALWEKYRRDLREYNERKAVWEKNRQLQSIDIALRFSERMNSRWIRCAIGDHAWKTEPEGYHDMSIGQIMPFIIGYHTATGQLPEYHTGIDWIAPLGMIRSGGGGYSAGSAGLSSNKLIFGAKYAPKELQPALVWEFRRRYLPDRLDELTCEQLAFAFAHFPMDLEPVHPEKIMPKVIADRRKGAYVFRDHYGNRDDIVTQMFFRAEQPTAAAYFHQQAGSFRISGLGQPWAVGAGGDKRNWQYAQENVVLVPGSEGRGLGKVTYAKFEKDGSGVLAADMSHVHNHRSKLDVAAERHFAVDYSGLSGSPGLWVVMDVVKDAKGTKTWRMHTPAKSRISGTAFTLTGEPETRGATLTGRFVPTDGLEVTGAGGVTATTDADTAVFFTVMTLQRDKAPEIKITGKGTDATITVGKRTIRFDGEKLVME